MKKGLTALLFLGWLLSAGAAWAEPLVSVSHTLTGYTLGADSVVLNYSLTVKNIGIDSISNINLFYIPLSIYSTDQIILNVGALDPQAEAQVPMTLTTPMLLDQAVFHELSLLWECEAAIADGPEMFPLDSVQRGAL